MSTAAKRKRWRCFHCDETFTSEWRAREHFGYSEASHPACRIKAGAEGGLLTALRRAEGELAEAWAIIHGESSEAQRAMAAQSARHFQQLRTAEEAGYERGVQDGILYERNGGEYAEAPAT